MPTMRYAKELSNLFSRDTVADQLNALQAKVESLRDLIPYTARKPEPRGYALPAALLLGGIAAIGAVTVLSLAYSKNAARKRPYVKPYEPDRTA
jgi:hypothetical protein